jgi:hypothetical protein
MTFPEFPVRQISLIAKMRKIIEGIQSQILKIWQNQ